ncbi:hypothetical protein BGZ76_005727 [Entomortierella beljakovae]|nr:hypothetical protein BGZ76_005727 [Entomortierella beljakovae]
MTQRSYCCFCIPYRLAVAIFSVLTLALGGSSIWFVLDTGITDTPYRINAFIFTGVCGLLGISGICAVTFKKYALAKNFSVLWWTVTFISTVLGIANIILLATRQKDEAKAVCQLTYSKVDHGDYALPEFVDACYKYLLIGSGVGLFIVVLIMSAGGWVASRYTREVKHQKEGMSYTYRQGYGPLHPQPQPHLQPNSTAHPYTNLSPKSGW